MNRKIQGNASRTPTVLLPGGGGTAAMCALKSLRMVNFQGKIVTTDADPLSPAFFLADAYAKLPPISDPRFLDSALEFIEREHVSLILPTSGFDIVVYSQHKAELARRGVTAIVSDYPVLDSCIDKWKFYQLTRERFPLPQTTLHKGLGMELPCVIKPVRGKGSREIVICRTEEELVRQLKNQQDLLVQEYLPGEEYSIDVLSDLKGNPLVAVPRVRLATKEGISVKGRVFHDPYIQQVCMDLAHFLKLKGPSCMQMRRTAGGEPKFLEVNPRMGGGTIFATLAGINFAQLQVALAAGKPVEIPSFRDVTVLRYYEEVVLEE